MMNRIVAGVVGLTMLLSVPIIPKNVDESKVIVANDTEIVMCVKRIKPISEQDKIEMAKCVYAECRGETSECQRGVCAVLYNRYKSGNYASMHEVIFAPNQFATSSLESISEEDIVDQLRIVDKTLKYGPSLPEYVIYFRASDYHSMSDAADFVQIDKTYFSLSKKLYYKYTGEVYRDSD